MDAIVLVDVLGRQYRVTPNVITRNASSMIVPGSSAVILVTAKGVNGEVVVVGIHDLHDATQVSGYFKQWDTMDANGKPMHADRQLGATHYGTIPCHPSGLLDLYLPLVKAYPLQ